MNKLPKLFAPTFIFLLSTQTLRGGSATWNLNPGSGDWNTATNWTPATVPNGPVSTATFALSNTTDVSVSANTEVNGIVFNAGASAFTITASPTFFLTFSGVGITNNSGTIQNFVAPVAGGNNGRIFFFNSATAGMLTAFTNNRVSGVVIGSTNFNDTSSAGNGTFINNGGLTVFGGNSTAGNGSFNNNGGAVSGASGGGTDFNDNSTAGNGTFINSGGAVSGAGRGGTDFVGTSTAGNGSFTNNSGAVSGADPGFTHFLATSTAGNGTFTNNGGVISGAVGGETIFSQTSTAGNATLIATGSLVGGGGGFFRFLGDCTGGTARVKVFGNGSLDINGHNIPGVTIGSIEGSGTVSLGPNNLTVGSNNLNTSFSGVIQDGGANGSFTKVGTGILTFEAGASNDHIADTVTLLIANGSTIDLNFTGTPDTVNALIVGGIPQAPGVYGSAASGAPHQLPEFAGPGQILVPAAPTPTPTPAATATPTPTATATTTPTPIPTPHFQLPGDFFAPGVLFENYAPGSAIAMTSAGTISILNGDTTSTGPGYTSANFSPYIMLDQARSYVVMHPGVGVDISRGASIGYRVPQSGFLNISGRFARQNDFQGAGDGVTVMVIKNFDDSTPLFTANIDSNHAVNPKFPFSGSGVVSFNHWMTLATNDVLRFVVFAGNPPVDAGFDSTTLRVTVAQLPPVITSPLAATGTAGQPFVYQFEVGGATSVDVTNLPQGLAFNQALRAIVGTSTAVGTFQVGLSATNSNGTTNATLTITLQPAPTSGPVIISSMAATGRVGQPFIFRVITTGGTPAATVSASGLPQGLVINAVTGLISGTPTAEGSSPVILTVTDGGFTTSATLQLTFTVDPTLPVIISPSSAPLTPNAPFHYAIVAPSSAGPSDPTVFAAIGLPPGLGLDTATGIISGTYSPRPDGFSGGTLIGIVQLFATNSHGTATIQLFLHLPPPGLVNISTRMLVDTGDNILIGGFIVTGDAPRGAIIRAIGPSLIPLGIPNALPDPTLTLYDSTGAFLTSDDNWRDSQEQIIINTAIPPTSDLESAIVLALSPGDTDHPGLYTAKVAGNNGGTGIGAVEVYELGPAGLDASGNSKFANISSRGLVQTGNNVMIGGFIINPPATRVLLRAIGPSLSAFGVENALPDTVLELHDNNTTLRTNDNWRSDQEQEIIATTIPPSNDLESAIIMTLPPGAYTAIVRGNNDTTGVALVEVYALP